MEFADPVPVKAIYSPRARLISCVAAKAYDRVLIRLDMPETSVRHYGAPRALQLEYRFYRGSKKIDIDLSWFGKQANRLPEASWFSIALNVDNANLWQMDKLGERVSPLEVVKNGNRNLHAVNTGVHYDGADGQASILTLDAPLLSPGEKRILRFDQTFAPLSGGMHFNLHNNVWGTNFPMWYAEDTKFRFSIVLS